MNVKFYYNDNLIGIWCALDPAGSSILEKYTNISEGIKYNKRYYIEDVEDFFDKACCEYYDLNKIVCNSNIIEEILYFTKCSNSEEARKQIGEIRSWIRRKILTENFNDRIVQLYRMFKYYKSKDIHSHINFFYFKYTKD